MFFTLSINSVKESADDEAKALAFSEIESNKEEIIGEEQAPQVVNELKVDLLEEIAKASQKTIDLKEEVSKVLRPL